jgi:DNA-binding ferritin-like protein (Dps family)
MKKVTFTKARYRQCSKLEHNANYLISSLPEKLSQRQFKHRIALYLPEPNLSLNKPDKIDSILKIKRDLFIPTRQHLDFYDYIYSLMLLGYDSRNPLEATVIEWTYDIADVDIPLDVPNEPDTTSDGTTIIGKTGLGKSRAIDRILHSCFPQVILHQKTEFEEIQVTYLKVDMPHDGSRGGLCKAILQALDNVLKEFVTERYYDIYVKPDRAREPSIPSMERGIHMLLRKFHVGLLVIDELQNLLVEGLINRNKTLQFFDSLSNQAEVPVIRIGTSDALNLFRRKHRHIRRAGCATIEVQPMDFTNKYWQEITDQLFSYQFTEKKLVKTESIVELFYDLTRGYPYALISLWQQIQIHAINFENTKSELTEGKIREIWKTKFPLLCRVFNAIKNGQTGRLDDILDAQHFIEIGNIDQAIKHINHAIKHSKITGVAAKDIAEGIDTMVEGEELSPKQKEKLEKVKNKLCENIGTIKLGQTYEGRKGIA